MPPLGACALTAWEVSRAVRRQLGHEEVLPRPLATPHVGQAELVQCDSLSQHHEGDCLLVHVLVPPTDHDALGRVAKKHLLLLKLCVKYFLLDLFEFPFKISFISTI
jgi:hypothetical protein